MHVDITVTNVAPTISPRSDPPRFAENRTDAVEDYDAEDPGGGRVSWSIPAKSPGTDKNHFTIDRRGGVLTFRSPPDFENPQDSDGNNDYTIKIRASDPSGSMDDLDITVTVTDVNEAPDIDLPDLPDYAENGTDPVATYMAVDPEGDTIAWTLPDTNHATDRRAFTITGGVLKFEDAPDFESPHDSDDPPDNDYEITIKASDGELATRVHVTVTVTDVNEEPVGKTIANRTLRAGVASLQIDLSHYFSDPDTNDTLTYTAVSLPTGVVNLSVEDSMLTLERVSAGSATITVTAADRPPRHADRLMATEAFPVTVDPPLPTVTITRQRSAVDEGDPVVFTVWADSAPTSALRVNVRVSAVGSFLTGTRPSQVTIQGGNTMAQFTLRTFDDEIDEENGTVTATVRSSTDYSVGLSSSASVTVRDDDKPPPPTGLRANGDLVGGNVTLRWNSVSGATGYNVQYVEEVCDSDGVCDHDDGGWTSRPYTAGTSSTVIEADLRGLTEEKLYRIQVQAVIVDPSGWSEFTLLFPTDSAIGHRTDVATAPFHGYQAKNAQGSHELRYVLCTETIPAGLAMTTQDMKNAVDEWEDAVIWDRNGTNIITTTAYSLPSDESCHTVVPLPKGRFEVKFASDRRVGNACGKLFPWQNTAPRAGGQAAGSVLA